MALRLVEGGVDIMRDLPEAMAADIDILQHGQATLSLRWYIRVCKGSEAVLERYTGDSRCEIAR